MGVCEVSGPDSSQIELVVSTDYSSLLLSSNQYTGVTECSGSPSGTTELDNDGPAVFANTDHGSGVSYFTLDDGSEVDYVPFIFINNTLYVGEDVSSVPTAASLSVFISDYENNSSSIFVKQ